MVMMTKCPVCGGKIMDIHGPIEWDVKGEQIIVDDADYCLCASCGEIYLESGMDGDIKFEKLIGAGPKTVVRWERGSVFQNRTADTLMRVVRDFPEVAAHLMKRVDEPRTS